jgi:hypothetical protein
MEIKNMGTLKRYQISWIDISTGQVLATTIQNTGLNGNLRLRHPDLPSTGLGLLFFKAEEI